MKKYGEFFKPFGKFFTLNYDVVLYRLMLVLMNKSNNDTPQFTDGFTESPSSLPEGLKCIAANEFSFSASSTVHYLHGAFHLLCYQGSDHVEHIIKAKAKRNTNGEKGKFLMESIQELKEMHQWLKWFILLEESAKKKLKNIQNNRYLNHCFEKFQSICGVLVTYGVRFGESDQHILDAIVNNQKLKAIYVGYHSEKEKKRLEGNFEKAFEKKEKKPIIKYFSTEQNPFVEDTTNSTREDQSSGAPSHL